MKIDLFCNVNYKNTSVATKASTAKVLPYKYAPIKNIVGNRCACCNREMIPFTDITNMWAKITLPISKTFSNKYFEFLKEKHPQLHKVLSYFSKMYPDKSFDSIVLDDDNHLTFITSVTDAVAEETGNRFSSNVAYRKALKRKTMEIFNAFECDLKNSYEVIKEIKPFEKFMLGATKEVFEELEMLASKYPDKKIHDLVQIPEAAEKYTMGAYKDALEFAEKRDYHWNRANNTILKANPALKHKVDELNTKICASYEDYDPKRTAYLIQKSYKDFLKENNLTPLENDVIKEVSQMPVRELTKNVYMSIVKNNYSDGAIIRYIVRPFTENEKHLIPPKDGGSNEMNNKVIMCRQCCDDMGNIPFREFHMYNPQMTQNVNNQLKLFESKIIDGSINPRFYSYPIEVAKTLDIVSGGAIKHDLTEYIDNIMEMRASGIEFE